jgi:excinuclease UvrABC nuclease subunit
MTPLDKKNEMRRLRTEMNRSAKQLDFENAARIRDYIAQLSQ